MIEIDNQYSLDDEIPAFASLTQEVTQCDCCGKRNLKRTVCLSLPGVIIHLGITCIGQWFNVTTSGNPHYAVDRINSKLRTITNKQITNIINEIKESSNS